MDSVQLLVTAVVAVLTCGLLYRKLRTWIDEAAVVFSVPVPEQCESSWDGKVLDKPNVKVEYVMAQRRNGLLIAYSIGSWLNCDTMLLPGRWTIPWASQSCNSRWH